MCTVCENSRKNWIPKIYSFFVPRHVDFYKISTTVNQLIALSFTKFIFAKKTPTDRVLDNVNSNASKYEMYNHIVVV